MKRHHVRSLAVGSQRGTSMIEVLTAAAIVALSAGTITLALSLTRDLLYQAQRLTTEQQTRQHLGELFRESLEKADRATIADDGRRLVVSGPGDVTVTFEGKDRSVVIVTTRIGKEVRRTESFAVSSTTALVWSKGLLPEPVPTKPYRPMLAMHWKQIVPAEFHGNHNQKNHSTLSATADVAVWIVPAARLGRQALEIAP